MHGHAIVTTALAALIAGVMAVAPGCGGDEAKESPADIHWIADVDSALTLAKASGKPVMIDFMATWCPPCRKMEDTTFCDPAVAAKAERFVTARVDVDEQRDTAVRYGGDASKYGGIGIPNILFLDGDGRTLKHVVGFHGPAELVAVMDSVLAASVGGN